MELKLNSLGGYEPITFQWPYKTKEQGFNIIEAISYACQEESPLQESANDILDGYKLDSFDSMLAVCSRFNQAVDQLRHLVKAGEYAWQAKASVPLLHHVLQTCYDQAVHDPDKLNHYEPFSAEVYGETSYELVDKMINTINFTKDDRFIDLGSGVGHVVLQVAAATSCSYCYGVEKAHWPALYAKHMSGEFEKWMRFYGKEHGAYELFKGNFLSDDFKDIISQATVIFVNNFAFGPQVDHELKCRFGNLKEGTRIVSSKAFCPSNMHISERNLGDIGAILTVQELSPLRGFVSWTPKQVAYYLHTVDRTQLEEYFRKKQAPEGECSAGKVKLPAITQQQLKEKSKYWKERRRRIANTRPSNNTSLLSPRKKAIQTNPVSITPNNTPKILGVHNENLKNSINNEIQMESRAKTKNKNGYKNISHAEINNLVRDDGWMKATRDESIERHNRFNNYFRQSNTAIKTLRSKQTSLKKSNTIQTTKLTACNIILNKIDDHFVNDNALKNKSKTTIISKYLKNQTFKSTSHREDDNIFKENLSIYISPEHFKPPCMESKVTPHPSDVSSEEEDNDDDEEEEEDNEDDIENALQLFHHETIKIINDEDYSCKDIFNDLDLVASSARLTYLESTVNADSLPTTHNNQYHNVNNCIRSNQDINHLNNDNKINKKDNDKNNIHNKIEANTNSYQSIAQRFNKTHDFNNNNTEADNSRVASLKTDLSGFKHTQFNMFEHLKGNVFDENTSIIPKFTLKASSTGNDSNYISEAWKTDAFGSNERDELISHADDGSSLDVGFLKTQASHINEAVISCSDRDKNDINDCGYNDGKALKTTSSFDVSSRFTAIQNDTFCQEGKIQPELALRGGTIEDLVEPQMKAGPDNIDKQATTPSTNKYTISLPMFSPITPETPIDAEQLRRNHECLQQEMQNILLQQQCMLSDQSMSSSSEHLRNGVKPRARKSISFDEVEEEKLVGVRERNLENILPLINSEISSKNVKNNNNDKMSFDTNGKNIIKIPEIESSNISTSYSTSDPSIVNQTTHTSPQNMPHHSPLTSSSPYRLNSSDFNMQQFTSPSFKIPPPNSTLNTPKNLRHSTTPYSLSSPSHPHLDHTFFLPNTSPSLKPLSIPISFPRKFINCSQSTNDTTNNSTNLSLKGLDVSGNPSHSLSHENHLNNAMSSETHNQTPFRFDANDNKNQYKFEKFSNENFNDREIVEDSLHEAISMKDDNIENRFEKGEDLADCNDFVLHGKSSHDSSNNSFTTLTSTKIVYKNNSVARTDLNKNAVSTNELHTVTESNPLLISTPKHVAITSDPPELDAILDLIRKQYRLILPSLNLTKTLQLQQSKLACIEKDIENGGDGIGFFEDRSLPPLKKSSITNSPNLMNEAFNLKSNYQNNITNDEALKTTFKTDDNFSSNKNESNANTPKQTTLESYNNVDDLVTSISTPPPHLLDCSFHEDDLLNHSLSHSPEPDMPTLLPETYNQPSSPLPPSLPFKSSLYHSSSASLESSNFKSNHNDIVTVNSDFISDSIEDSSNIKHKSSTGKSAKKKSGRSSKKSKSKKSSKVVNVEKDNEEDNVPKLTLCFSKVHPTTPTLNPAKDGSSNADIMFPAYSLSLSSGKKKIQKSTHQEDDDIVKCKNKKNHVLDKNNDGGKINEVLERKYTMHEYSRNRFEIGNNICSDNPPDDNKHLIQDKNAITDPHLIKDNQETFNLRQRLPKMHFSRKLISQSISNNTSSSSSLTSSSSCNKYLPLMILTDPPMQSVTSTTTPLPSKPSMCFSPISSCGSISPIIAPPGDEDEKHDATTNGVYGSLIVPSSTVSSSIQSLITPEHHPTHQLSHNNSPASNLTHQFTDDTDVTLRQDDTISRPDENVFVRNKRKSTEALEASAQMKRIFSNYPPKNSRMYDSCNVSKHAQPQTGQISSNESFPTQEELNTPASLVYLSLKNQSQPSSVGSHRSDSRDSGYDKDSESDFYEKINLLNGYPVANTTEISRIDEYCNDQVPFKEKTYHDSAVSCSYKNKEDKINDYLSRTSCLYNDKNAPSKSSFYDKSYYSRKVCADNTYYEKTFSKNSGENVIYNNAISNKNGSNIPHNNLPFNHMHLLYNQPPLSRPSMYPHHQTSHHHHPSQYQPNHQSFNHPFFHQQSTQLQPSPYQTSSQQPHTHQPHNHQPHTHQPHNLQPHTHQPHNHQPHHNLFHFTDPHPHISNGLSFESLASHYEQHSKSIQQSNTNTNH